MKYYIIRVYYYFIRNIVVMDRRPLATGEAGKSGVVRLPARQGRNKFQHKHLSMFLNPALFFFSFSFGLRSPDFRHFLSSSIKFVVVPIIIMCCALFYFPLEIQAQTLDAYLIEAAENNPGLKSSYFEFEAAMQKTTQAKALPDMSLSFGYFISPVETRVGPQRAKFSLVQMFPWFGTNETKANSNEFYAQSKYQEFLEDKNELHFRVKAAYYPFYELLEHIKRQQENLDILKTYKRLATITFSNGKGDMVDVIRTDIMIDDAEINLQLLEDQINPLEVAFNRLLNRPDSLEVFILDSLNISSLDYHYKKDSIFENNPSLQSIDYKIQRARAQEETAHKQGLPTFGIGIDYVITDKRTDIDIADNGKNAFMPMVSMSLPLFRGKYKSSIKEAQFIQSALVYRKLEMENQLISSYEMSRYELDKEVRLVDLYNDQIIKTQQAINLIHTAYGNSGRDFEEVLRMQQQLLKYEMAKASATKNYYLALAKLDYLTSKSE